MFELPVIADDPDEDADSVNDDAFIDACLAGGQHAAGAKRDPASPLFDWPVSADQEVQVSVDAETLEWFRSNYPDWRRQIQAVLRSWVLTSAASPPEA